MKMSKVYTTKNKLFQYGYVAKASDMCGKMEPEFEPHWWAQYLGDGITAHFNTRAETLAWIRSWEEIGK
jgi:hypothetical protein